MPSIAASRDTFIAYKQKQARALKRPWWQRSWLDGLLLIPSLYGTILLQQQDSIVSLSETNFGDSPFQNPLLFLIPTLSVLSLNLLFIRLLPWILSLVTGPLARSDSVSILLAARQLARTPRDLLAPF